MENQESKKQLAPPNNKALYHSLSALFASVLNDEIPLEKADRLVNIASKMQKSLEIEIHRARTEFIIGSQSIKLREIEITNPET